jgi:hypothetical protein
MRMKSIIKKTTMDEIGPSILTDKGIDNRAR